MKKKMLILGATACMSVALVGTVIAVNSSNGMLAGLADVTLGTLTFEKSTVSGTTTTSVATTSTGAKVKCIVTDNDSSVTSNHVAALKTGSIIRFYEEDGVTEYTFEDIDKFALTKTDSSTQYSFVHRYISTTGEIGEFSFSMGSGATRTANYSNSGIDASQFHIECTTTNSNVVYLSKIVLTYNCTTKKQTGIVVDNQPSKIVYQPGESFDPTGMLINSVYDNGTEVATNSYTVSPARPLTADDTFVTITSRGFTTTQPIIVTSEPVAKTLAQLLVEKAFVLTGKFGSYNYELTVDFANGTVNARRGTEGEIADFYSQTFSYSVSGSTVSITAAGDPQQTGPSLVTAANRLKVGGTITATSNGDEIVCMSITLYNQNGYTRGRVTL